MDLTERLFGHDRWMTAALMTLSKDLTDAQLDQEFDIGHQTLRRTFDHIILANASWTGVMEEKRIPWRTRHDSIEVMLQRHASTYDHFEEVARGIIADGRIDETFKDPHDYPQTYGGTILHVILHSAGHRSEALHIMKRLGLTDLPEGDPQEWEHFTGFIAST
jgi:uncharacterized damage-inducible protein DinB